MAVGITTLDADGRPDVVALAADARADGTQTATLRSADGSQRVQVVYADDGQGFVIADSLERLPAGRTYQLWTLVGSDVAPRTVSAGVLGRSVRAAMFEFDGPVVGFAISVEDAPGATTPSSTRLQGRLD